MIPFSMVAWVRMYRSYFCFGLSLLALGACSGPDLNHAKYWQRIDVTEAWYLNGGAAQKRLNRDIAVCVRDIKTVIRTNQLREAIPPSIDPDAPLPYDEDQIALNDWDTPERDNALRTEHLPYQNFETCMKHYGWRRTEFVPDDVITRAKKSYADNLEQATGTTPKNLTKNYQAKNTNKILMNNPYTSMISNRCGY